MSSIEQKWIRFAMEEAFPAESKVAQWVAGLCMAANDLILAQQDWARVSKKGYPPEATYYIGVLAAHLREAMKFVWRSKGRDALVEAFCERLGDEARVHRTVIDGALAGPKGTSFVEQILVPVRNQVFHYPEVGATDIRSGLEAHAKTESGVRMVGPHVQDMRWVFADEVRAELLAQALGGVDALNDALRRIATTTGSFVVYASLSFSQYRRELARSVMKPGTPASQMGQERP
jgi:hypothetical protein